MGKPTTAKKKASAKKAAATARAQKARLSKQTLVDREGKGKVPDVVGGKTPPTAPGRRRAFGLRALER
jgi:hypothetical protein